MPKPPAYKIIDHRYDVIVVGAGVCQTRAPAKWQL